MRPHPRRRTGCEPEPVERDDPRETLEAGVDPANPSSDRSEVSTMKEAELRATARHAASKASSGSPESRENLARSKHAHGRFSPRSICVRRRPMAALNDARIAPSDASRRCSPLRARPRCQAHRGRPGQGRGPPGTGRGRVRRRCLSSCPRARPRHRPRVDFKESLQQFASSAELWIAGPAAMRLRQGDADAIEDLMVI